MIYFDLMGGLYKREIRYLIVGGLSVNLYGVPRLTLDIDVVVDMDKKNVLSLISLLGDLGYVPRLPVNPEDLADPDKVRKWIEQKNLKAFSFYHKEKQHLSIDVVLDHPLDFDDSFHNRTVKNVKDIEIYLAAIDDVICMKRDSGRAQDLSDIEALEKVKKFQGDSR